MSNTLCEGSAEHSFLIPLRGGEGGRCILSALKYEPAQRRRDAATASNYSIEQGHGGLRRERYIPNEGAERGGKSDESTRSGRSPDPARLSRTSMKLSVKFGTCRSFALPSRAIKGPRSFLALSPRRWSNLPPLLQLNSPMACKLEIR